MRTLTALVSGILFGLGLTIAGMVNPEKVLGFLDFAGDWDPSLAFVLASAIPVAALGFAVAKRRGAPACAPRFFAPDKTAVDMRLVGGAALFGIGWGLAGYCPGPALASATIGGWKALLFILAMLAGMLAFRSLDHRWIARGRAA